MGTEDEIPDRKNFRRMCFTYNLENDEIFSMCDWDQIKRYVFQKEKAPTTGQEHIQGYVELKDGAKWSTWKHKMPTGCHMESCKGSAKQNYEYCTKKESQIELPVMFGDWTSLSGQGRRSDLTDVTEKIKTGAKWIDIANENSNTFVRYEKGLRSFRNVVLPEKRETEWEKMDCRWYFGEPGTGKTERVFKDFKEKGIYFKNPSNKWWDGYDPQEHKTIIIDDYRPNKEFPYDELLRLCQPYEFRAEVKGSTIQVTATTIIITSNEPPWVYWPMVEKNVDEENAKSPMNRRFWYWKFVDDEIEKTLHTSCQNLNKTNE